MDTLSKGAFEIKKASELKIKDNVFLIDEDGIYIGEVDEAFLKSLPHVEGTFYVILSEIKQDGLPEKIYDQILPTIKDTTNKFGITIAVINALRPFIKTEKTDKEVIKKKVEALVNKRFANYVHCTSIDGSTGIRNMLVHEIMILVLEGFEEFDKATKFLH
jgi:hypothetical protein